MLRSLQRLAPLPIALAVVAVPALLIYNVAHASHASNASLAAPVSAANLFDGGSDQARITAAVRRDKPSVVALDVYVDGTRYVPVDPFGDTEPQAVQGRASGSGFVYDANGTIVTNAHVISPPSGGQVEKIDVLFANGDHVPGHVISVDRSADLALVRVDRYAKLPPALPLGESKKLEAGQWAIAIGEPLELRQTVTVGVVSGFDRSEPIGDENGGRHVFRGLLQTSAPINPGNSGGPLIDMDGQVIGINQSVAGGAQGIGFAIPVDTIRTDVAAMLAQPAAGGQSRTKDGAFVGIGLVPLSAVRSTTNYAGQGGVAVQSVKAGGPADTAGVAPGDVIVQIDGQPVDSPDAAVAAIRAHQPGESVQLQVWRAGATSTVAVQTAQAEPSSPPAADGQSGSAGSNDDN